MDLMSLISAIFGGLGTIGGLVKSAQGSDIINRATAPGGLPGTVGPGQPVYAGGLSQIDQNPFANDITEILNTGAQYDPYFRLVPSQIAENDRAEAAIRPYLDENKFLAENTGLNVLADQQAGDRGYYQGRSSSRADTIDARSGQVAENVADTRQRLQNQSDNPNVATPAEISAIVGNLVGSSNQRYAEQASQLEQQGAARGASADSTRAATSQLGSENLTANQGLAAQVALTNATNRANIQGDANKALAALDLSPDPVAELLRIAEGIDTGARSYGDASRINEAGLRENYATGIRNANLNLAELEQPTDFLSLGDRLYTNMLAQAMLKAGDAQGAAELLSSVGSGLLGYSFDRDNAQTLANAQRDASENALWGNIFGGGLNALGLGIGGALGGR